MGTTGGPGFARGEIGVTEEVISERRLWTAVLVNAVEDWRTGTLRSQREAQEFLFSNDKDFEMVCSAAGLDSADFRMRLLRIGRQVEMEGSLNYRNATPPPATMQLRQALPGSLQMA
jgi:hypothetical protein